MAGQRVLWILRPATYERYEGLLSQLLREEEWSEAYCQILDEIKSLPGFPHGMNEEEDVLEVVAAHTPKVGYTGSLRQH